MGYDYWVKSGRLRLAERAVLAREILSFAAEMELGVVPMNWIATGEVFWRRWKHDSGLGFDPREPLVSRPLVRTRTQHAPEFEERWELIDQEQIQGIVLFHPYADWVIAWNLTHEGTLAAYYPEPFRFDRMRKWALNPVQLIARSEEYFEDTATPVDGEFSEWHIHLHCPWRRSDALAACDLLAILARHSDDFVVSDDFGIWPSKDLTKWTNFCSGWAEALGGEEAHPDMGIDD